jgi:hypothetical protein
MNILYLKEVIILRQAILERKYTSEMAQKMLTEAGYEEQMVQNILGFLDQENASFLYRYEQEDALSRVTLVMMLTFVFSSIPALIGVTSWYWYAIFTLIVGTVTYFLMKSKRIAAVLGAVSAIFITPIVFGYAFAGRSTAYQIEVILLMLPVYAFAFFVYYIASKILYRAEEIE